MEKYDFKKNNNDEAKYISVKCKKNIYIKLKEIALENGVHVAHVARVFIETGLKELEEIKNKKNKT